MGARRIIGLTGGIACGKTNLTDALRDAGERICDADEISRALTKDGGMALPLIREAFGDAVFHGGCLDRRALADRIFASPEDRKKLEAILHPLIFEAIRRQVETAEGRMFLSAPLLYECALDRLCDTVWCAWIPEEEQIRRLEARDRIPREKALEKIRSQMSAAEKAARADLVIPTDGTPEESRALVLKMLAAEKEARHDG